MINDKKEIIILTKSSKYGGLCVTGVDYNTGEWIRLVKKDGSQISMKDMRYADGSKIEILDCILAHTLGQAATPVQPENVYLNTTKNIEKIKKVSLKELIGIHGLENNRTLLGNNLHVIRSDVDKIGHSLELVKVKDAVLNRVMGSNGYLKSKLSFYYNNLFYKNMSVTDPDYYDIRDGTRLGNVILVISIPDDEYSKIHGYFKFVAKIFR